MENAIKKFFELRDQYWENEDMESFIFLKHVLVYFYEYRNVLRNSFCEIVVFPGKYDLVKADTILSTLGYRGYSIDYIPKSEAIRCDSTKITFRNTL